MQKKGFLPSASSTGEAVGTLVSFRSKHLADYVHCLLNSAQILKLKQRSCPSKKANSKAVVIKCTFHSFLNYLFFSVFFWSCILRTAACVLCFYSRHPKWGNRFIVFLFSFDCLHYCEAKLQTKSFQDVGTTKIFGADSDGSKLFNYFYNYNLISSRFLDIYFLINYQHVILVYNCKRYGIP